MAVKEQLEQVRSLVAPGKEEQASTILKTIENEFVDLSSGKSASDSESKGRKIKIREMDVQLEDKDIRIAELEKKINSFDDSAIKKERDNYAQKYKTALKWQQDIFVNNFGTIEKHPNFDTILKSEFKIPEKDDKNYKWDSLKDEDWEHNITKYNELNKLKYFESSLKPSPDTSKGGRVTPKGEIVPTYDEAQKLKIEFGTDSPQYKRALALRMQK